MSKVVFVIGAGATFNEAKEAATSDFPPLDKGFFDKYKDGQDTSISDIKKYLESTYNINIFD